MNTKIRNKVAGFTIIEVLIVLAIAGLIMLVVFLAVPALQRNSRNSQRRSEVATLLSAVTEYVTNSNGKLPGVWDSADKEFQNAAADADGTGVEPKTSFYTATDISFASSVPSPLPSADAGKVYIYGAAKCNGNTPISAGGRNFVAYFGIESSSSTNAVAQCTES